MKKLLAAASMAAGLAAGAVPAFAQSATTSQPGWAAAANNGAPGWGQAPNYYTQAPTPDISDAHTGDGSGRDYLRQQQELQNMPGYSIGGNG